MVPFQCYLPVLLDYFPYHHRHWMIFRCLVKLACPTLISAKTVLFWLMYCLLTSNRDTRALQDLRLERRGGNWASPKRWQNPFWSIKDYESKLRVWKWIPDLKDVFDFFLSSTFRRNDSIKSASESFPLILFPHAGPVFWQWFFKKMKFQSRI